MPRQLHSRILLLNELVEKIFKDLGVQRQIYTGVTVYANVLIQMVKTQLTVETSYKEICDKVWDAYKIAVETNGKKNIIDLVNHYYNSKILTQIKNSQFAESNNK